MLAVERRRSIHRALLTRGSVIVVELAREFSVSHETIRRDLARMESEGLLDKTYGGAYVSQGMHRVVPATLREHTGVEGKRKIGEIAAEMIHAGDTIFLDSSTTALCIANRILDRQNLVVITDGVRAAETLARADGIRIILVGGTLQHSTLSMVGKTAEFQIGQYFGDKAFVSCDGLHLTHGITDSSEEGAGVRKRMIRRANEPVLIADATKFNRTSFVSMAEFSDFSCLVTDQSVDAQWVSMLSDNDVSLECGSEISNTLE